MWPWLCLTLAQAQPDLPFPRADDALMERRFSRLVGDGPAWGSGRNRSGAVQAWIFSDGVVEHAVISTARGAFEERRYDASGGLLTTAQWRDGAPAEVVVHVPEEVAFDPSGWAAHTLPGAVVRAPAPADGVYLAWSVIPGEGDPLSDGFRDGLAERCACRLEDRTTAWIEGRAGAQYRVQVLDPVAPWTGEVWAVAGAEGTLMITALVRSDADGAPVEGMGALATGRAMAALVRWGSP